MENFEKEVKKLLLANQSKIERRTFLFTLMGAGIWAYRLLKNYPSSTPNQHFVGHPADFWCKEEQLAG